MPYTWTEEHGTRRLAAWPYRSLSNRGFAVMIGATAGLLLLPLLAVLGSPVLWALLPFLMLTIAALWFGLRRSDRDARIVEELTISPDAVELVRHNPRGPSQHWQANPFWTRAAIHAQGGPVAQYITLKGDGPREVELGRFLSAPERLVLYGELCEALARATRPPMPEA
ncbi:DUF2244 domain-containing protein [Poseidonocella sedimentorum]|uniref:Uncharacterized membrane protein n=1 Tax=Poseidonocella sedimentorum TaxID=871652 RepID=A0A1I6DDH2_9RHOB|nr:DUF2244 domain-containing protein [Poseidonocella sedimentorum]SFR03530.1 Uncharacterized membrane protein [Poseidonocella sedimentorum]